jgi:hypothetical protein
MPTDIIIPALTASGALLPDAVLTTPNINSHVVTAAETAALVAVAEAYDDGAEHAVGSNVATFDVAIAAANYGRPFRFSGRLITTTNAAVIPTFRINGADASIARSLWTNSFVGDATATHDAYPRIGALNQASPLVGAELQFSITCVHARSTYRARVFHVLADYDYSSSTRGWMIGQFLWGGTGDIVSVGVGFNASLIASASTYSLVWQ